MEFATLHIIHDVLYDRIVTLKDELESDILPKYDNQVFIDHNLAGKPIPVEQRTLAHRKAQLEKELSETETAYNQFCFHDWR